MGWENKRPLHMAREDKEGEARGEERKEEEKK